MQEIGVFGVPFKIREAKCKEPQEGGLVFLVARELGKKDKNTFLQDGLPERAGGVEFELHLQGQRRHAETMGEEEVKTAFVQKGDSFIVFCLVKEREELPGGVPAYLQFW